MCGDQEDDDLLDEETLDYSDHLTSAEIELVKSRLDSRRKLEYLQELKALKKELGDDYYYDDLLD